jgi:hypothetical protein
MSEFYFLMKFAFLFLFSLPVAIAAKQKQQNMGLNALTKSFKRLITHTSLLWVVWAFAGTPHLQAQNNPSINYDTTDLRESPCQVKKITLTADTAYKVRFELRQDTIERYDTCRIKLNWPLVKGCKNARVDSFLNETLKKLLKTKLLHDTTNILNNCHKSYAKYKSDFDWFMNDRLLSVHRSISSSMRYYNGLATIRSKATKSRGYTSGFNYDLIAEKPLTFENFFKEQYHDTLLKSLKELSSPACPYFEDSNKDNFIIRKNEIWFYPCIKQNKTSFSISKYGNLIKQFEKSEIKHYIKEKYYGSE